MPRTALPEEEREEVRTALPEEKREEVRAALPEESRTARIANANGTAHPACTRVHARSRLEFALATRGSRGRDDLIC